MVRKLIVALGLMVAISGSMATQAQAYTAYDGTPSNTYITYYRDMLAKYPASADYVVFRSSQYEYIMAVGDLDENGARIQAGSEVDICAISTNNGYNSNYSITYRTESGFVLDVGDEIIYSNLGRYPCLEERRDIVDYATLFVLSACAMCGLFRSVFEWRNGLGSNCTN